MTFGLMAKTKKKREKKYDSKLAVKESVQFDDLIALSLRDNKKKAPKKKSKK